MGYLNTVTTTIFSVPNSMNSANEFEKVDVQLRYAMHSFKFAPLKWLINTVI